jgi:hypothetical protein
MLLCVFLVSLCIFHKDLILPGVLYQCDALPVTLTEKRKLRVFENRVLRN